MAVSHALAVPLLLPLLPISQAPNARPPVVVVEGDFLGADGAALEGESQKFAANVRQALEAVCVPYETSTDSTVEKWGLPQSCRVALLPYNRAVSAGELAELRAYLERGGKLIIFYVGPDDLLLAVGVRGREVVGAQRDGQFAAMELRAGTLPTLPDGITQNSWNVRQCRPVDESVVLGNWVDAAGADSGVPAAVLGAQGAFISHVFASGNEYRKGQLLRAIIGHFVPTVWPGIVRTELSQLNAVGRFGNLARLRDHLQRRRDAGHLVDRPLAAAQRAIELREAAQLALAEGNVIAAVEAAAAARMAAGQAFYASYPSKPGELRGAWMIYRGRPTWDETMRRLSEANLNAVMPRFCSAGVAYFPSSYLPESSFSRENGDQLAQATAAAQKYGVPIHARMLALFIYEAPDGVQEAYRKAGRLMIDEDGKSTNWLCPSHPENRKAVIGACLEMASRYPVAGIQLDYVRYPWTTYCYCPTCKAKFQRDLAVTVDKWPFDCRQGKYRGRFADWRREQITSLVRELRLRLKDLNPDLQFSADVFVNWRGHRESFGQDWKAWVDEGLCDFVCPIDYFKDDATFTKWVTRQRKWIRDDVPMCVGIGPRVKETALDPQRLLDQIELSRKLGGDGFVLFEYDELLGSEHLPIVGAGVSSTPSHFTVGPPHLRCKATSIAGGSRVEFSLDTGDAFPAPMVREGTRPTLAAPEVVVETAEVTLYTADAWPVLELGTVRPDEKLSRDFRLTDGTYRLCAQGTRVRPGARAEESFVRWGPSFEVMQGG